MELPCSFWLPGDLSADQQRLLRRDVDAFESYDVEELCAILRADAVLSMPPTTELVLGALDIDVW